MPGEKKHSTRGASSMHRWGTCAGAPNLEATCPPDHGSEHAREGTSVHDLIEICLRMETDPELYIGTIVTGLKVTNEMAEGAKVAVDHVRSLLEKYPGAKLHVELELDLTWLHEACFGTADIVIVVPMDRMIVLDYKNGRRFVGAQGNEQLLYYGLGALKQVAETAMVERVELGIIQPHAGDEAVRMADTLTPEGLEFWGSDVLLPKVLATYDKDAPLIPGEKQCQWCRAAKHERCPARRQHVMSVVPEAKFNPIESNQQVVLPLYPEMTPDQLGRWLRHVSFLADYAKGLEAYCKGQLQEGREVPGKKLVAGRKTRKVADENALRARLPPAVIYENKMRSVAQLEKAAKAAGIDPSQWADLIEVNQGVSMVDITDKRPAVNCSPGFKNIT